MPTHRQLLKEAWEPDSVFETHYLRVYIADPHGPFRAEGLVSSSRRSPTVVIHYWLDDLVTAIQGFLENLFILSFDMPHAGGRLRP